MAELTKSDVKSIVKSEIDSKDFEKMLKKVIAASFNDFFRVMYQNRAFVVNNIEK
jgi:hypothetical protein